MKKTTAPKSVVSFEVSLSGVILFFNPRVEPHRIVVKIYEIFDIKESDIIAEQTMSLIGDNGFQRGDVRLSISVLKETYNFKYIKKLTFLFLYFIFYLHNPMQILHHITVQVYIGLTLLVLV